MHTHGLTVTLTRHVSKTTFQISTDLNNFLKHNGRGTPFLLRAGLDATSHALDTDTLASLTQYSLRTAD